LENKKVDVFGTQCRVEYATLLVKQFTCRVAELTLGWCIMVKRVTEFGWVGAWVALTDQSIVIISVRSFLLQAWF